MAENLIMDYRKRSLLMISVLLVISTVAITLLLFSEKDTAYKPGISREADEAVRQALQLYKDKKSTGYDFSTSKCFTNDLMKNWAVDLVHVPRNSSDNLPENQCHSFLEGRAKHLIEIDKDGNLIRIL